MQLFLFEKEIGKEVSHNTSPNNAQGRIGGNGAGAAFASHKGIIGITPYHPGNYKEANHRKIPVSVQKERK